MVTGYSSAILHGHPETTQEFDMFLRRTRRRTPGRLAALQNLESELGLDILAALERGVDFARTRVHPIAADVEPAPDGTSSFEAKTCHGQGSRRVSRLPS